ncbi:MAG: hypothetical protein V3S69_03860 [Dehalococcoidales bacterium]
MTKEQEYRDKLIKLTDMIHDLDVWPHGSFVYIDGIEWDQFLGQVSLLEVDAKSK